MRRALRVLGAAVLLAGPTVLAFFSGGFFDRPRLIAALAAWGLVVGAAAVAERPLPRARQSIVALAGLGLLTALTALSFAWSPIAERTLADLERLLLYLGWLLAAVALLRPAAARRAVEPALAAGVFVVLAYALSERLLPGAFELARSDSAAGRLEQPLTYWNAMGALAAIGLVLCVRLAGDASRVSGVRRAAASAAPLLAAGLYLTFSRGAIATAILGVLALLLLAPDGRGQLRGAGVVMACGVVAATVAALLPDVSATEPGQAGSAAQGAVMLAVLIALGAVAALLAPGPPLRGRPVRLGRARTRRACAVGVAVAAVAAVLGSAALEQRPDDSTFGASASRLTSVQSLRYQYWQVALRAAADSPVIGVGSGGFAAEWLRERDIPDRALDAHSLYFETAAELGLAGLLALALLLGGVAAAATRVLRDDAAAATGPVAAMLTWAAHAGLDWDWEVPALTLVALTLAGAALAAGEVSRPRPG